MPELGPPPLNIQPIGLLSFFGIQNGGRNPQELISALQPMIEVWEHYVSVNSVEFAATFTALVASTNAGPMTLNAISPAGAVDIVAGQIQIPQNEIWYVSALTSVCNLSAHAGTDADFYPGVSSPTVGTMRVGGTLNGYNVSSATVTRTGRRDLVEGFWCRPGGTLFLGSSGAIVGAGGNVGGALQGRVARLRI